MIERMWPVLAVIERCAVDLPELEALYFQRGRRGHLGQLTSISSSGRPGGHLRTMPDATVAARIVTEAIVWFAWHRREDRDAALYDDERARRTVIQFVCYALDRAELDDRRPPVGPGPTRPPTTVRPRLSMLYLGPVLGLAAGLVALELAVAGRYGYHRDELYFLACARHLAWGYVDQPPLVPAVARLATALFGSSVVGLRVFPALAGGAAVVFTGLHGTRARRRPPSPAARRAGGRHLRGGARHAMHLLSTAAFDLFFWSAITLLVSGCCAPGTSDGGSRSGRSPGSGCSTSTTSPSCFVGLAVGLVASGRGRPCSRVRGSWAGAGLALAIWSPEPGLERPARLGRASPCCTASTRRTRRSAPRSASSRPSSSSSDRCSSPSGSAGCAGCCATSSPDRSGIAYLTSGRARHADRRQALLPGRHVLRAVRRRRAYGPSSASHARGRPGGLRRWWPGSSSAGPSRSRSPCRCCPSTALAKGPWEGQINKDLSATVGWHHFVRQIADVAAARCHRRSDPTL